MVQLVGSQEVKYSLENIEQHAANIRDNVFDINSGLHSVLAHLRGEALSGASDSKSPDITGKLAEISTLQQWSRGGQDETFRLIAELKSLLNVSA